MSKASNKSTSRRKRKVGLSPRGIKPRRRRSRRDDPGPPPGKGAWFDVAAADHVCQFFELFLTHHRGETAGAPFTLAQWQRNFLRPLFGWKRPDGMRWYRRGDLWIPKKNGKSAIAAGIALYLTYADGELGAEVYAVANDRTQAEIVFGDAAKMVKASPELLERSQIFNRSSSIVVPETLSSLRALSGEPGNKDGLNISGLVFDEIHELKRFKLWEKMTAGSTGSRAQPLFIIISTAGYDRNTVGWREYQQDKRILKGESEIDDRLVVIYEASQKDNWQSEKTWHKANPALGSFLNIAALRSLYKEAKEDPSKEAAFKRYHLNMWTSHKTGWIDEEDWNACAAPIDLAHVVNLPCWIGLDLSKRSDISAALALFKEGAGTDARYHALAHFWVPEEEIELKESRDNAPYREWARAGYVTLTPGNCIEYASIRDFLLERWARKFQVREIPYDPYNATHLADDLQKLGLTMVEYAQVPKNVCPPTMELKNLVLQQRICHGGNPVLSWMVDNVAVVVDVNGNERLTKKASATRIDGVSALVNALGRAMDAPPPSVYKTRGVIAI